MSVPHNYNQLVQQFRNAKVLCIGDLMLDTFNHGTVTRISPERPVPVFRPGRLLHVPGGAGNVASNVVALGAQCSLIGCVGNDEASVILQSLLNHSNMSLQLVALDEYTTTHKVRFTAGTQHLLRLDEEHQQAIPENAHQRIRSLVEECIISYDVLVLSDYAKGVFDPSLVSGLIAIAKSKDIPVIVDPKGSDLNRYSGATLITPNTHEAEVLTGIQIESDLDAEEAGVKLLSQGNFDAVLITRGSRGMTLCTTGSPPIHFENGAIEVFDVVGAGDTVVATLACATAANASTCDAANFANIAAGIVVGKRDTATVSAQELITRIDQLYTQSESPRRNTSRLLSNENDLIDLVRQRRLSGQRIGFTNGVFDIVHPGHVSILRFARDCCDMLIVAINSDVSVRLLNKGPDRPINSALDRASVISAFEMVDALIIFDDRTPLRLIQLICPDVLIKGADYSVENVVGSEFVLAYGGEVRLAPIEDGKSTSNIINRLTNARS